MAQQQLIALKQEEYFYEQAAQLHAASAGCW
jgi:hypothetical protein